MEIPTILTNIAAYLRGQNVKLSQQFSDERINSSFNENKLIKIIKENFEIKLPKSRSWYDFALGNEDFYPVNIKLAIYNKPII